jgi:ubiquinone/menaquinone biosynthesis C-methylase UbiE
MLASAEENKAIYNALHDTIIAKRFDSPFPIRRYAHRAQYDAVLENVPAGATVIDVGCGEGVLSILLAKKGCRVTGVDLSAPNIESAKKYAEDAGVSDRVTFLVGDAEHIPVGDQSFDYAVSSHVLEHLPHFQKGAEELNRIASKHVIIAIPTCLNPCAWVLLGGDKYWTVSRRSPYAVIVGALRVLLAFFTVQIGVNEGYVGRKDLIHIWRFPWVGKRLFTKAGLQVQSYRASGFPFPYFSFLIPLSKTLHSFAWWPVFRLLGYGTTYVCTPMRHIPPQTSSVVA